eukprot:3232479-Prymnesium_polylepis.2
MRRGRAAEDVVCVNRHLEGSVGCDHRAGRAFNRDEFEYATASVNAVAINVCRGEWGREREAPRRDGCV